MQFDVIIPALNEEETIAAVVNAAIEQGARSVFVVDNGSSDATSQRARSAGARVVYEPIRGYGQACLAGLDAIANDPPSWVLFCDGDGADDPDGLASVIQAAQSPELCMVIGNRDNDRSESGALTVAQRFGNRLACTLIRVLYRTRFQDLGPLRMIRWETLMALGMTDRNFGWTVEMQVKIAKHGFPFAEVDVKARCRRGGRSKISGTIKGSAVAGVTILKTIFTQVKSDD